LSRVSMIQVKGVTALNLSQGLESQWDDQGRDVFNF